MPLYISTIKTPTSSASAVFNSSAQQNRATTVWETDTLFAIPDAVADWHDRPLPLHGGESLIPTGGDQEDARPAFGRWKPMRTARRRDGDKWVQTTYWGRVREERQESLAALLTDRDHMLAQAKRLTKFAYRQPEDGVEDISGAPLSIDETKTNALGRWNHILRNVPSGPYSLLSLPLESTLDSGAPLMDLYILPDLNSAETADLNVLVDVLAGYQLVLDPSPAADFGDLAFLLDAVSERELPTPMDWSDEEVLVDPDDQPIACQYLDGDAAMQTLTLPAPASGSPATLTVREPAGSRAEAELEIALQRARLAAERLTAGARVLIEPSMRPLDAVRAAGHVWVATRVTHRWPAGQDQPETTDLQLRAVRKLEEE